MKNILCESFKQIKFGIFATTVITFIIIILSADPSVVDAQQPNITRTGIFNYTQTDVLGDPDWIDSGNWSITGLNSLSLTFNGTLEMVKPNGSESHSHSISGLAISMAPIKQNDSTIIKGTTTITMNDGFLADQPTTITLNEKNISVYFDLVKFGDHFGNQSIIGSIIK